jgi:DNA-binding beta-propeller fold protein YncE
MQKKPRLWLAVLLSAFLPLMAACGASSITSPQVTTQPTIPAGEHIYVLDGYQALGSNKSKQQIVAFHPGDANPTAFMTLPAGLLSLDHQRLYVTTPQNGQTTIRVINTQNGQTLRSLTITGTYSTAGQSYTTATISADGHWLALLDLGQNGNRSIISLVDTQAGKLVKTIWLNGSFELDAMSMDGNSLYLLQRLDDHTGHYDVKLYNVAEGKLYDTPIVDKTEVNDPRMTGTALTRQVSSDGLMVYTLYINTLSNTAFVHILPLQGENFPFARCVDLPVGKSADLLPYYTLALSPDGRTLYATNGALGLASTISLTGTDTNDIFDDKITATTHFNPGGGADTTRMLYNGAVLSPDGKMLYVAVIHGVWAIRATDLSIKGQYLAQQNITGVAISSDGRTLYAVDPAKGITLLDLASGQAGQVIQGPARTPWGIAWISQ